MPPWQQPLDIPSQSIPVRRSFRIHLSAFAGNGMKRKVQMEVLGIMVQSIDGLIMGIIPTDVKPDLHHFLITHKLRLSKRKNKATHLTP